MNNHQPPFINQLDQAVSEAITGVPVSKLTDYYGYPANKAVESLARRLHKNEVDVYTSLKFVLRTLGLTPLTPRY
jgi:hypothetical protein